MRKIISIAFILLFSINFVVGQKKDSTNTNRLFKINRTKFLHFGIRPFFTYTDMAFSDWRDIGFTYYFANEKNETIISNEFSWDETITYTPFPDIYLRYNFGNNLFFQVDFFALWFTNVIKYKNSVDISEYSQTFNPAGNIENLGYNQIKLKWFFTGNTFSTGIEFLKTKKIQPVIFGGFSSFYLMSFKPGDYYQMRSYRNKIIFANLDSYKLLTFYWYYGGGLKYRGFTIDFFSQYSQLSIDANDCFGCTNVKATVYSWLITYNISISINLLSFNLNKNKLQK